MNEIEKLYKNAEVEEIKLFSARIGINPNAVISPPFTAKKQIKLLQFLTKLDLYSEIVLKHTPDDKFSIEIRVSDPEVTLEDEKRNTIGEAIAAVINQRWEFLTKKGKKKIKEILEEV